MVKDKDGISVVINTFNAGRTLRPVLESLIGFDEIVICDMDSTDDTLLIAADFNCRVVNFPKGDCRICEPARDFAVHSASSKWVLVVDSDELVQPALKDYLYSAVSGRDVKFAGLCIPRRNCFMGGFVHGSADYQLRFFRRDKVYWPPIIHARPVIDGVVRKIPHVRPLELLHLDDASISSRIEKINVYSDYEVPKRRNKNYGIVKMLFRPVWFFIKTYVIGGSFLDGKRGVCRAFMSACYQMVLLSKLVEKGQYGRTNARD